MFFLLCGELWINVKYSPPHPGTCRRTEWPVKWVSTTSSTSPSLGTRMPYRGYYLVWVSITPFLHDSLFFLFQVLAVFFVIEDVIKWEIVSARPQWKPTMTWPLGTSSCTCWLDTSHCFLTSLELKSFVQLSLMASFWLLFPGGLILSDLYCKLWFHII